MTHVILYSVILYFVIGLVFSVTFGLRDSDFLNDPLGPPAAFFLWPIFIFILVILAIGEVIRRITVMVKRALNVV